MLKAVLTALIFLLVSALPASADPITAAVTAIGAVLKAGGIAATLLKAAFAIALKAGLSLYEQAKQRRANRKKTNGVTLSVQFGDTLPRSYILGTRATAGHRFYIGYWGEAGKTPNAYISDAVVLSCLPSYNGPQGLDAIWVGKRACTILWGQPHPDGRGFPLEQLRVNGVDYGWVKYLDGTQTDADPFLRAKFGGHAERPFKASMIGRGCQIAIITLRHNTDLYNNQLPAVLYQPKPPKIYDLRKDGSAGGSGGHRWSDPSTWESSDNLVLQAYTVARGLYYRGRWVHGGRNFSAYRLPASSWMAAANEADRDINGRRQFRGGLEISVDTQPVDAIEDYRVGCSGRFAEVGGQIKLLCGAPGSPVYSFTDADIVVTEDQGFAPFESIKTTYNTATAIYPNPAELWTNKDAPEYSVPALLARDGGERLPLALETDAVSDNEQVQALQKTALEEAQRMRVHEFFVGPEARALEPNDPVAWTSEANFYTDKEFIVVRATPSQGNRTRLVVREWDPSDYTGPSIYIPAVNGPIGSLPIPVQIVSDWDVIADYVRDETGTPRQPAIRVKCAGAMEGVTHLDVEIRVQTTEQVIYRNRLAYVAPFEWTIGPMPAETMVEAAGTLVSEINPNQQASVWKAVRTYAIATDLIVDLAHIGSDVRNRFQELAQELDRLRRSAEELGIAQSLVAAGGELSRQSMLAELGDARAEIVEERLVRASETEALAVNYMAVAAQVASAAAAIITEQTARVTGDSALATSIQTVNAEYGGRFAGGLIKFEAAAAPSGVDARFAVLLKGGTAESYKASGLYIDLYTVGGVQKSRVAIMTDQFVVTDGSTVNLPLVYEGGVLKLASARVAWAQIDGVSIDWAEIGDAVIENAVFGTTNLDFGSVTDKSSLTGSTSSINSESWTTVASVTIANPNPNPVMCQITGSISADASGGLGTGCQWRLINTTSGEVVYATSLFAASGGSGTTAIDVFRISFGDLAGDNVYRFQVARTGASSGSRSASISVKFLWWKR